MVFNIPAGKGADGQIFSFTVDTDQIAFVGPLNSYEEFKVTLKDGKTRTIREYYGVTRAQIIEAWKRGQK